MRNRKHFSLLAQALAGGMLLAFLATRTAAAATVQTTLNYSGPLPAGITQVKVENLAGHVQVTQGPGFAVTATVVAGGSDQAAAQALARAVKLETSESDGQFTVHVYYPVDQYDSYSYAGSKTSGDSNDGDNNGSVCFLGVFCVNGGGSSGLRYQDTGVRVYTGGQRGTPLHVDLTIQVPVHMAFAVTNYVGRSDLDTLQNDVRVKTASGDAYGSNITGTFGADTGSGDVHVKNLTGDFSADTGSGDVFADGFKGSVNADTGSGDVHLSNGSGPRLSADTGSGDVFFTGVSGDMKFDTGSGDVHVRNASGSLHASTGSGEVRAENYTSGPSVWADTGSGDVNLAGNLSAMRKLYIDTGSGDATLRTSSGLSLRLDASSNSGELNINLPDMSNVVTHRGSFSADFGKAEGKGTISTGSGDITVTQS
ncbi:MAG: DUF4097 family beta strand repeat protein [Gammaproteobacteria bacterium]|nr:DUF4097 family beta strand repeat protein [Gammaproteobacteria bacterium]MDE2023631.1 DUF4097 family beta strand repeat protein [Gammaproteobacteria bacterium]MDE2139608.1 DUF4097 family beta strand repeat protein [Gammaproteobacteria bacterium]MDE2273637.1 DUF4097 family beta strand repeat protein [Gammaproteobacteria bacterium]